MTRHVGKTDPHRGLPNRRTKGARWTRRRRKISHKGRTSTGDLTRLEVDDFPTDYARNGPNFGLPSLIS